jgi:streptogramin lyase
VIGQTGLRSFDLTSGAAKGTYPFPTTGGVCNDMAISANGTVYATESFNNRIHRLRPTALRRVVVLDLSDARSQSSDGVPVSSR